MSITNRVLSERARQICGQYFPTPESVIRSVPPHETLGKMREAMDELVACGWVTERPGNDRGLILLTGSAEAAKVAREVREEIFRKSLLG